MSYKVSYAGINLHDYFTIFNVDRKLMPPRQNFAKDIPGIHGKYYMGYKYGETKITLECLIKAHSREERMDIIRQINFILDVDGPKRFIADDSPETYCYAVPEGEVSPEKIRYNAKFNLEFVCYDPITYSLKDDFFLANAKGIVDVNNAGTTEAYPKVMVGFKEPAHFLQCTNYRGETVLIGAPPNVDKPNAVIKPEVLRDDCETLEGWIPTGNVVDSAEISGSLTINGGGYAICCNNYGSGDQWHGAAMRKNLGTSVSEFRAEIKFEHNSLGDVNGTGAGDKPPSTNGGASVKYKITADPSLRIRQGRSTNTARLGSIPRGTIVDVTDIQNNWGKVTYGGKTGYIYMQYTQKYSEPASGNGTYKCTAEPSLRIRSGRGTNYKQVGSIKYGATTNVTDISNNWGKVTYGGKTGYVSMQYMTKTSASRSNEVSIMADENSEAVTAEDRLGRLEVYGFGTNGERIFKVSMKDLSEWYEYSEPEIQIGSTVVLDDNKTVPSPQTINVKDEKDENKTVTKKVDSGKFGDWNEFFGYFIIERRNNSKGQQEWNCRIEKLENNKTAKVIQTNTLINDKFPKVPLTSVVIFIGQYKQVIPVDVMSVNEINVFNLSDPPKPEENIPIFKAGDELLIDYTTHKVYLNGQIFMDKLDIGSQFFSVPVGNSQMICKSDGAIDAEVSLQKRWV